MFDRVRAAVLRFMRVPAQPEPPFGAPGSIRVFRAGRNYYKLRLLGWIVGQVGAGVGIMFSLGLLTKFEADAAAARQFRAEAAARAQAQAAAPTPAAPAAPAPTVEPAPATEAKKTSTRRNRNRRNGYNEAAARTPSWVLTLLKIAEAGGIALFLVQIPITYAMVRLEFEQHWYIVTDRSLRIRTGLVAVQESTMSYANLQQVQVKQGPLQRLLGLANVEVQSAGGGGDEKHHAHGTSLHTGVFHSVENAQEIRDLILERLRQFRQVGLGDPDDHAAKEHASTPVAAPGDAIAAAQELLAEARALRAALS